jgi:hypothetical protein
MKRLKYSLLVFVLLGLNIVSRAQDDNSVEMADTMRSSGKIYVVIAVILTILAGLILYIIRLDKKITKLEKEK